VDKLYYLLVSVAIIIFTGSLAIFSIESGHPDSQIDSMLDAAWWTVATVTTVGYGDIVPVTDAGRIMAILYMFFGISFLAIFLSVLGTRFYKKRFETDSKDISHAQSLILKKMDNLEENQEKIQKKLQKIEDSIDEIKEPKPLS